MARADFPRSWSNLHYHNNNKGRYLSHNDSRILKMQRELKNGFHDMGYKNTRSLQISNDGKRVLKISASPFKEFQTQRLFEHLAPQYAPSNTHLVTLRGEVALEMDYAGACIGDVMYELSESEFALCLLQSVEMLLLIGNALRIGDFHPGNVCFENRGPTIQIRFIDTEQWIFEPAVGRKRPDGIIEANTRNVLFGFWENIIGTSKNMQVHKLKYQAIVYDKSSGILFRLYAFAQMMRAFVEVDDSLCAERAREIEKRIAELFKMYMFALNIS